MTMRFSWVLAAATAALWARSVVAQTSSDFDATWNTLESGGAMFLDSSDFVLGNTIGQGYAGEFSSESFVLHAGFWAVSLPAPTPCTGDINGSGEVNVDDLLAVITNWAMTGPNPPNYADLTGDQIVNVDDLLAVITSWGQCPIIEAPLNDDCQNAQFVTSGSAAFDTTGATTDGLPHAASCNFFDDPQISNDIWFKFVSPGGNSIVISLCGSDYDTELAVYGGFTCPPGDASLLACNDDFCDLQSQVVVPATPGMQWRIRVGGYQGAAGKGVLTISLQ